MIKTFSGRSDFLNLELEMPITKRLDVKTVYQKLCQTRDNKTDNE